MFVHITKVSKPVIYKNKPEMIEPPYNEETVDSFLMGCTFRKLVQDTLTLRGVHPGDTMTKETYDKHVAVGSKVLDFMEFIMDKFNFVENEDMMLESSCENCEEGDCSTCRDNHKKDEECMYSDMKCNLTDNDCCGNCECYKDNEPTCEESSSDCEDASTDYITVTEPVKYKYHRYVLELDEDEVDTTNENFASECIHDELFDILELIEPIFKQEITKDEVSIRMSAERYNKLKAKLDRYTFK